MKFLHLSTQKRGNILSEKLAGEPQGFSPKGENIEKTFFSPRFIAHQGSSQRGNNTDCVIMRTTDSRARITSHCRVIRSILQYWALSVNFRTEPHGFFSLSQFCYAKHVPRHYRAFTTLYLWINHRRKKGRL